MSGRAPLTGKYTDMGQHGQTYEEAWDMVEDIIGDLDLPMLRRADMERLMETIDLQDDGISLDREDVEQFRTDGRYALSYDQAWEQVEKQINEHGLPPLRNQDMRRLVDTIDLDDVDFA